MTISFITSLKTPTHRPALSHRPDNQGSLQRTLHDEHWNEQWLQRWENEGGRIVTMARSETTHLANTHH